MSATIMETLSSNKGLGFAYQTTVGFQLRNAFPLADPGHPPIEALGHLGVSAALPLIATSKRSAVQPPATPPALALAAQPVRSPSVSSARAADVGWQGLLEISRTSGASGVLGCSAAVDEQTGKDTKIEICCTAHTNNNVRRLVKSVIRGLKACQEPEKASEGMGGTYFFVNEDGRKVAIMKPCDEEPLAPNNPKGYVGRSLGEPGWKPTVRVGEAAMREVAAYLLDRDGWARVPTSVLVRARHPIFCYNNRMSSVRQSTLDLPALAQANAMANMDASAEATTPGSLPMKLGSLQEFVNHKCDTSEMSPSRFSVSDVHRIGILDVRLFNTDRHAGNMLVRVVRPPTGSSSKPPASLMSETQYELVPIDHGFCLPETLEACYFEWLHWPQAMLPFSEEELKYIKEINVEADKDMLRKELPNLRPECLRVMELATTLLQRGAEAGLTLFDIASIMTRPFENGEEEPSELERTAAAAKQALENAEDDCDDCIEEGDSEEGDCSSSAEEVGDSDCDAAFGVYTGDAELEQTLQALEARARSGLLTQTSSRAEDSMLFDLDDYLANGAPATPKPTSARSPGAASLGSSLSSADDFSFDMNTTSLLASSGTPVASGSGMQLCTPQANGKAVAGASGSYMASSVCVTGGGFLWRRAHRRSAVKRAVPKHSRSKPLARSPAPYPPPVVAFAPDSLNGLFRDMDEVEWQRFMGTWEGAVDAALRSGRWKKGLASNGPVAQSCPRF